MSTVLVAAGDTVRFNVAKLSQPDALVNVAVWDPEAVNVNPFHVYGS